MITDNSKPNFTLVSPHKPHFFTASIIEEMLIICDYIELKYKLDNNTAYEKIVPEQLENLQKYYYINLAQLRAILDLRHYINHFKIASKLHLITEDMTQGHEIYTVYEEYFVR